MARRRKKVLASAAIGVVVLDSGALSKIAELRDALSRAIWRELTERGWGTCVPAVVLAEVMTGKARNDSAVDLLLRQVNDTIACDEALGRSAGTLRARIGPSRRKPSGIDAIVAAVAAAHRSSIVLTTDPRDMSALLDPVPRAVVIGI